MGVGVGVCVSTSHRARLGLWGNPGEKLALRETQSLPLYKMGRGGGRGERHQSSFRNEVQLTAHSLFCIVRKTLSWGPLNLVPALTSSGCVTLGHRVNSCEAGSARVRWGRQQHAAQGSQG